MRILIATTSPRTYCHEAKKSTDGWHYVLLHQNPAACFPVCASMAYINILLNLDMQSEPKKMKSGWVGTPSFPFIPTSTFLLFHFPAPTRRARLVETHRAFQKDSHFQLSWVLKVLTPKQPFYEFRIILARQDMYQPIC